MKTRFAFLACLAIHTMACDRSPPVLAVGTDAAPQTEAHAGYVPGNRIDALAVNCELCDEAARQTQTFEWDIVAPGHPVWVGHLTQLADHWEKMKVEHGPNSDEALVVRNELVLLRKRAVRWAGFPEYENGESVTSSAALAEQILLNGGAVKTDGGTVK